MSPGGEPGAGRLVRVETTAGAAHAHLHDPRRSRPTATVVLGHGAGGGVDARDLVAVTTALVARGHRVVLVESPWRVTGGRVASPPGTLDVAWLAVLERLSTDDELVGPLVVGGRSAGARVACRTAAAVGADAVLALAFPLHPPGRPERDRGDELRGVRVPVLAVQGERDPFGSPAELRAASPAAAVVVVPSADHGFRVPARAPLTQGEALGVLGDAVAVGVAEWVGPAPR